MSARQTVEQATAKMQAHDVDGVSKLLSDDLTFSGTTPQPIGKEAYLATLRTMFNAFPDFEYHSKILEADEQTVRYLSRISGTHTGELDLSNMGMGIIPPTGKSFRTAEDEGEITVKDGKITRIHINASEESGIQGILRQLGVQPE